jgi:hypothetical protein
MLQGNKLITADDSRRLESWVDAIEQTALSLLSGCPPHKAVYHYAQYIVAERWWDNIVFFVPLMAQAVSDPEIGDTIEMILTALSKLGGLATTALPALTEALRRQHSWNKPEFETQANLTRTTELVRGSIQKAIDAIESGDRRV